MCLASDSNHLNRSTIKLQQALFCVCFTFIYFVCEQVCYAGGSNDPASSAAQMVATGAGHTTQFWSTTLPKRTINLSLWKKTDAP